MGDVMDEIREEARKRTAAREAAEQRLKASAGALAAMDGPPAAPCGGRAGGGGASSSSAPAREAGLADDAYGEPGEASPMIDNKGFEMDICGPTAANPCVQLFAQCGAHLPSDHSFRRFFREWFEREFWPVLQKKVKKEMQSRAYSQGVITGLVSHARSFVMQNTGENMQADAWYKYFARHSPPSFASYGVVRAASVNMCSQVKPFWVTFWGFPAAEDGWTLMPWASLDIDTEALVDELDGRGGISALVAAAAG